MLKAHLIPDLDEDESFQHDGVPCYRSYATEKSLANKGSIILKDCPAQRTDLNIKANVERRVCEKNL